MDLRYRLAVVTDAGAGVGREVAVALSRVGAAVLSADRDLSAAEETATLAGEARVQAWALQVDTAEDADLQLLADRARDLGGMDLLVVLACRTTSPGAVGTPVRLTQLFVRGLAERRGRTDGSPAVVLVSGRLDTALTFAATATAPGARVMAVVPGDAPDSRVARTAVDLLARGTAGQVVHLSGRELSRARPRTT
jgi:3-oxoacyl-[acyl-carrier protein] reductase